MSAKAWLDALAGGRDMDGGSSFDFSSSTSTFSSSDFGEREAFITPSLSMALSATHLLNLAIFFCCSTKMALSSSVCSQSAVLNVPTFWSSSISMSFW